ncbi:MAG: cytochrome c maturation protein CcmE [Pseudomonadota bacterium]
MKAHRKQKLLIIIFSVIGLGSAVILTLFALQKNINLFFTPTDIAEGKVPLNQVIRIGGLVVDGSVSRDPESLKVSFALETNGDTINISFEGILPDLFREGQGIVAMGKLVNPSLIEASEVLAKHDENYMPPELAEALKEVDHSKEAPVAGGY